MAFLSLALSFVLLMFASLSFAYPNGAGDCPEGVAAVGGAHLGGYTNTLESAGFQVTLDGTTLISGSPFDVEVGYSHTIILTALGSTFSGFLIRVGGTVDTTQALTIPSSISSFVKLASDICVSTYGVGGITHSDSSDKQEVAGFLQLDTVASNLPVDITVVVDMNAYYYSGYTINVVSSVTPAPAVPFTETSTPAPTPAGTAIQTAQTPTPTTFVFQTPAPTPAETSLQTPEVTVAPVASATISPTAFAPTADITAAPTGSLPIAGKLSDFPSISPSFQPTVGAATPTSVAAATPTSVGPPTPTLVGPPTPTSVGAATPTSSPVGGSTPGKAAAATGAVTSSGPSVKPRAGLCLIALVASFSYLVGVPML